MALADCVEPQVDLCRDLQHSQFLRSTYKFI